MLYFKDIVTAEDSKKEYLLTSIKDCSFEYYNKNKNKLEKLDEDELCIINIKLRKKILKKEKEFARKKEFEFKKSYLKQQKSFKIKEKKELLGILKKKIPLSEYKKIKSKNLEFIRNYKDNLDKRIEKLVIKCIFCNHEWSAEMEKKYEETSGCESCGFGAGNTVYAEIHCEKCKRLVYKKEFYFKSYD